MLDKILALGAVAHHVVSESTGCTLPPLDMPMTTRTPCSAIVPQSIEELPQSSGPTATGIATPSFVTPQCQPAPTTVPCRAVVSPVSSLESTVAITNHVIRTAASGKASPLRAGLRAGSGHPVCVPFRSIRPSLVSEVTSMTGMTTFANYIFFVTYNSGAGFFGPARWLRSGVTV